jgi:hypothetical protein
MGFFARGQGASEYLMILGAALLVALITITVLGYFIGFSGDLSDTESKTYWNGYASPFSIQDSFYNSNGSLCRAGDMAPYPPEIDLSIKNKDKYPLNITAIYLNGNTGLTICSPPGVASLPPYSFAPNEQKTVGVRLAANATPCSNAQKIYYNVVLAYNSPYINGKTENGTTKLVVGCT